jgi:methylated-DNA-protein-cysteine methyltransferase-like protein
MVERLTFDRIVWKIVWQIPEGRVISYGQIASMIPMPEGMDLPSYERIAPRWVGYAMRRCMTDDLNNPGDPTQPSIPWQRVINSQGRISLAEGSYDAEQQRTRLEAEGVAFDRTGSVDFDAFGWDGPDEAWLRANDLKPPYSLKRN